uniref:Sushi domain-containing protein n=1 Tax=Gopherus agassizii TaxID=38772 RepID=A0A452GT86_9SAUR
PELGPEPKRAPRPVRVSFLARGAFLIFTHLAALWVFSSSCDVPTRLKFAALSKEDEMKNYYPAGITVRYTCRPGYENITEMLLVSTCLDNLTWSEAPEFCRSEYLFLLLFCLT